MKKERREQRADVRGVGNGLTSLASLLSLPSFSSIPFAPLND